MSNDHQHERDIANFRKVYGPHPKPAKDDPFAEGTACQVYESSFRAWMGALVVERRHREETWNALCDARLT